MKLKYDFAVQTVLGEHIAVPVGKGAKAIHAFVGLNETGKRVFELLQEKTTIDQIVATMLEEYEVTEPVLREAVENVVGQLQEQGLIEE